jgi:hydrogenase expression/formation protein HypE
VQALGDAGIDAAIVGEVTDVDRGTVLMTEEGERPLEHPGVDPFWEAFGRWAGEAAGIRESA